MLVNAAVNGFKVLNLNVVPIFWLSDGEFLTQPVKEPSVITSLAPKVAWN